MSALCSNDPVCAQHVPGESLESRWLHGAACHGCALVAETSCEMRNDYLDRALVVPVLGVPDAAFFQSRPMSDTLLDLPSHLRERLGKRARVRAFWARLPLPPPSARCSGDRDGWRRPRRVTA